MARAAVAGSMGAPLLSEKAPLSRLLRLVKVQGDGQEEAAAYLSHVAHRQKRLSSPK